MASKMTDLSVAWLISSEVEIEVVSRETGFEAILMVWGEKEVCRGRFEIDFLVEPSFDGFNGHFHMEATMLWISTLEPQVPGGGRSLDVDRDGTRHQKSKPRLSHMWLGHLEESAYPTLSFFISSLSILHNFTIESRLE
jgi:hypothetical protein